MYTVEVLNPCRCFLRSGNSERKVFTLKEEAKEEAEKMLKQMNETFCQKHSFFMQEIGACFSIKRK
jgi:hypothetical protein